MLFSTLTLAAALVSSVSADTFKVSVGKSGLTFDPEFVNAKAGDTVQFIFHPKNHTVTQSSFAQPCENYTAGGFDSGFVGYDPTQLPPANLQVLTVNVEDEKPKWFSCRQKVNGTTHCGMGMVFSINPDKGMANGKPTSAADFKALALQFGDATKTDPSASGSASATGSSSPSSTDSASPSGSSSASDSASTSGSDSASATGSASASDSASGSGSATSSGSATGSDSASATGAASGTSTPSDAGKPVQSTSATDAAASNTAAAPATSPSSGAGAIVRNSAGAIAAAAVVLGLVL